MTRTSRLKQITARVEAATKGPWFDDEHMMGDGAVVMSEDAGLRVAHLPASKNITNQFTDAAFIAAARSDVPWLLREVERLREALAKCKRRHVDCPATWIDEEPSAVCHCGAKEWNDAIAAALEDSDDAE